MAVEAVEAAEAAAEAEAARVSAIRGSDDLPSMMPAPRPPPPEEDYSQIRESGWEERAWEAEKPASVEDVLRDAGAEALARLDEKRDALAEAERRWGGGPKASSSLADMD